VAANIILKSVTEPVTEKEDADKTVSTKRHLHGTDPIQPFQDTRAPEKLHGDKHRMDKSNEDKEHTILKES
jgi:hypothetical protein